MSPHRQGLGAVAALGLAAVSPLAPARAVAQDDFRAADRDRPIRVEDAFPVELGAWEVELGTRAGWREAGSGAALHLELATGLALDTELGVGMEAALEDAPEGTRGGVERFAGHALHAFNRETGGWPAFAARVELGTPGLGEVGKEEWELGLGGIATRSFERLRLHANGGYVAAADEDGGDHWTAGLGFDVPLGLFSRVLLGDLYLELPARAGRSRVWLELGMRWQVGNDDVLDFGLGTRLDEWEAGNANVELVLGISRVFGIPWLVRVPPYPSPKIN